MHYVVIDTNVLVSSLLAEHNKNNKSKTAELLGIGRKTLHRKLEEYGIGISAEESE